MDVDLADSYWPVSMIRPRMSETRTGFLLPAGKQYTQLSKRLVPGTIMSICKKKDPDISIGSGHRKQNKMRGRLPNKPVDLLVNKLFWRFSP